MNKRSGLILRFILGGYLVFLGGSVFIQAIQTKPEDLLIKSLFAVLFVAVGGMYAFMNMKKLYNIIKEETDETMPEPEVDDSTQPLFHKPQHDQSVYRTAPMPVIETDKKVPEMSKKEIDQETEPMKKKDLMPEVQKKEAEKEKKNADHDKNPVNLAIEIMREEEKDATETEEELEKDYEEK